MKYAKNVTQLIGNTPLIKLNTFSQNATILGKCEFLNPSGSIKDRIANNMIQVAIKEGKIDKNSTIIEPTSGNTGIGLATICASMGMKLILTMPSSMSIERRKLLSALGAKLVLTEPQKGMKGAVDKAIELNQEIPHSFIPQQFANPANPDIHVKTTAQEIWDDTDGKIDIFVAAVGTGGTLSGVAKALKEKNPNIKIVAVEPDSSAVLSGNSPAPHKIQGIGAGFIPDVLDTKIIDKIIRVKDQDAFAISRQIALSEGLLVGISSGANVYASSLLASENKNKIITTILCDTGERYLSSGLYE